MKKWETKLRKELEQLPEEAYEEFKATVRFKGKAGFIEHAVFMQRLNRLHIKLFGTEMECEIKSIDDGAVGD